MVDVEAVDATEAVCRRSRESPQVAQFLSKSIDILVIDVEPKVSAWVFAIKISEANSTLHSIINLLARLSIIYRFSK